MINIRPEVLEQIKQYITYDLEQASARTEENTTYEQFLSLYPKEKILTLTMDEYCTGNTKNYPNNFSNWIENGLKKCLGGYAGRGASPHLIYKAKDTNNIIKIPPLDVLTDEQALDCVLKLHDLIINSDPTQDISWLADDQLLQDQLGLNQMIAMPDTRKLRVLCAYHPDDVLHIFSKQDMRQFLFDLTGEVFPNTENAIILSQKLKECWVEIKNELNITNELSIHGFMMFFYHYYENNDNQYSLEKGGPIEMKNQLLVNSFSVNQILYGPPGTGKTYATVEKAVSICDSEFLASVKNLDGSFDRNKLKEKYDQLIDHKQIEFVTFHQSFSYEDFVEGIRAQTKNGQIEYSVEDGIFKNIVKKANQKILSNVWKLAFVDDQRQSKKIEQECLENNYILLRYSNSFDQVDNTVIVDTKYRQDMENNFMEEMKIGDLVLISDGVNNIRAIAEITSDTKPLENIDRDTYRIKRDVKWLRKFDKPISNEDIITQKFKHDALYLLDQSMLKIDGLQKILDKNLVLSEAKKNYVLIIDEINRGNIANIFGELITLLEPSKRAGNEDARFVTLPYSKESFSVPNNLHVIGTMNTSDHSLTKLDLALRRRFEFVELLPDYSLLDDIEVHGVNIGEMLQIMNARIEILLGRDYLIGHSYFLPLKNAENKEPLLAEIFKNKIIPLLQEYFFEDWERIQWVLNDQNKAIEAQFIHLLSDTSKDDLQRLFKNVSGVNQIPDRRYQINDKAFDNPIAYSAILG